MTGIFKQKTPANIIVLLVFGVLIKLPIFLYPHVPLPKTTDGALFTWVLGFLGPTGKSFPLIYPILPYLKFKIFFDLQIKFCFILLAIN